MLVELFAASKFIKKFKFYCIYDRSILFSIMSYTTYEKSIFLSKVVPDSSSMNLNRISEL